MRRRPDDGYLLKSLTEEEKAMIRGFHSSTAARVETPKRPIDAFEDPRIKKPEKKTARLLVTEQILAEYVADRLSQLEGRQKLTEEEAEELNSIRKNEDNPQKLADFYGMELRETIR